jgi:glycosyltransferase involved in cell wall biosynthesis
MKKLFGVQIALGFSPEARVFANLLANVPEGTVKTRVVMHTNPGIEHEVEQFTRQSGCEVVRYDTGWRVNSAGKAGTPQRLLIGARFRLKAPKIVRLAAEVKPDVIYSCQQKYDCWAATNVAKKLDKPQIIHLHYPIGQWLGSSVLKSLKTCDHIITVSDFIRGEALQYGIPPERVSTVRNSMNPLPPVTEIEAASVRQELGIPDSAFVFCNVGRLEHDKGQKDIIQAFSSLAPDAADAWLVIIGAGTLDDELRAQAAVSAGSSRILFTGRRSDVPKVLGAVNAFVHPSIKDACPLAILEAMGSGLPVVAYADGGAIEMLGDASTGYLVPTGDIKGLGDAMRDLYENPDRAVLIGKAARERINTDLRPDRASEKFAEVVTTVCR